MPDHPETPTPDGPVAPTPGARPGSTGAGPPPSTPAPSGERTDVYARIRRLAPVLVVVFCAGLLLVVGFLRPFESPGSEPEVRTPLVGAGTDPAAAYAVLHNAGGNDTLLGASTPAASSVELQQPSSADPAVLETVPSIPVPGFEDTRLQPGSAQLLLVELVRPLEAGDTVPLTLRFERAGTVEVVAEVDTYDDIAVRLLPPRLRIQGPDATPGGAGATDDGP